MNMGGQRISGWFGGYLAVFGAACLTSYLLADGEAPTRSPGDFWPDAYRIAVGNSQSLPMLTAGSALTFGVCGVPFFLLNGIAAGAMLGVLPVDKLAPVAWYAPVEVAAFAVAGAAAAAMPYELIDGEAPVTVARRASSRIGSAALPLLITAALLEAWAIQAAWSSSAFVNPRGGEVTCRECANYSDPRR